jgi:hypothetical protein
MKGSLISRSMCNCDIRLAVSSASFIAQVDLLIKHCASCSSLLARFFLHCNYCTSSHSVSPALYSGKNLRSCDNLIVLTNKMVE